ncbi:DNA-directed DNA polymerase alpha subunit pol12 [Coelomomyces lativittatus]|nr:DNA-directed DNA polymerase alpha subunit pol12 [Coelomomyces lativittatus]KAJ1514958.1 DNA-directed DNA polymerase alpha subunit pol12 [Coelomomyces lativittatus]KAJ1517569.1 DNA-directed DNA polymerase alpha subunit pol12 [Coelomomyces lativittatus]
MATLEIELQQYFGSIDDEVLAECAQICRTFKLDPDTFNLKWESYAVNHGIESNITMKDVYALKEMFQKALEKSTSHLSTPVPTKNPLERIHYTKEDIKALSARLEAQQLTTPSHTVPFEKRPTPGKVELQYNQHLESSVKLSRTKVSHQISLLENQQNSSFKYMYDKLAVMGEAMNDLIDEFESYYLSAFPEIESFENPAYVSQSHIYSLGRVVTDLETIKLGVDSIQLECARKFNGVRIPLQISANSNANASLFSGQIIAVYGNNPTGNSFLVEKVLQLPFLDPPSTSVKELLELEYTQCNQPILMLVAAGPYTLSSNLFFEPLKVILDAVRTRPPDVLILFGPFIDDRHPLIQRGQLDSSFDELFRTYFLNPLLSFSFPIILVPHLHDAFHEYLTFPQPPFEFNTLPSHLLCVSNPVQLCINECVIALISKDILMDMSKSIFQLQPTDRVQFCGTQVLQQRCIYPLFPPPENEGSIDVTKWTSMAFQVSPDLVLWPSQLRFHVKEIGSSIFVNPGLSCRGQSGGTMAWVSILPFPKEKLETLDPEEYLNHKASQRVFIEIVKL